MSLALEKLANLMFQIRSLLLKGRRSRNGSKRSILTDVTELGFCMLPALLEIWYGYQTGGTGNHRM